MNDKTVETRPIRMELTMPGPVCGCPLKLVIEGRCQRPEHDNIPAEVGTLGETCWLFSPDQLTEMMGDLAHRVMQGYKAALDHHLNELEGDANIKPEHQCPLQRTIQ